MIGRKALNCKGAETVELALTLPLVLFLIFGSIDISRLVASYSAVRTATAIGARQAVGVSRDEPRGVGTAMSRLSAGASYYGGSIQGNTFTGNLSFIKGDIVPTTAAAQYSQACDGTQLTDSYIYRLELRAIAYANYLVSRNAPQAPYPCDPGREMECFTCCTLRTSPDLYTNIFSLPNDDSNPYAAAKFVAIRCDYSVPLTSSVIGLGFQSKFFKVSASAYIPVSNYAGNYYDAE